MRVLRRPAGTLHVTVRPRVPRRVPRRVRRCVRGRVPRCVRSVILDLTHGLVTAVVWWLLLLCGRRSEAPWPTPLVELSVAPVCLACELLGVRFGGLFRAVCAVWRASGDTPRVSRMVSRIHLASDPVRSLDCFCDSFNDVYALIERFVKLV